MNTSPYYRKNVSVAMATFNGSKYLSTQLASLAAQEQLPDELVVVDDLSTDNTLEILQDFQATAPFSVKILKNKSNLGMSLPLVEPLRVAAVILSFCVTKMMNGFLPKLNTCVKYLPIIPL